MKIWRYTPVSEAHLQTLEDDRPDAALSSRKKHGERSCGFYCFFTLICTVMLSVSLCLLVSEIRLEIRELLVRSLIGDDFPAVKHVSTIQS